METTVDEYPDVPEVPLTPQIDRFEFAQIQPDWGNTEFAAFFSKPTVGESMAPIDATGINLRRLLVSTPIERIVQFSPEIFVIETMSHHRYMLRRITQCEQTANETKSIMDQTEGD